MATRAAITGGVHVRQREVDRRENVWGFGNGGRQTGRLADLSGRADD